MYTHNWKRRRTIFQLANKVFVKAKKWNQLKNTDAWRHLMSKNLGHLRHYFVLQCIHYIIKPFNILKKKTILFTTEYFEWPLFLNTAYKPPAQFFVQAFVKIRINKFIIRPSCGSKKIKWGLQILFSEITLDKNIALEDWYWFVKYLERSLLLSSQLNSF